MLMHRDLDRQDRRFGLVHVDKYQHENEKHFSILLNR